MRLRWLLLTVLAAAPALALAAEAPPAEIPKVQVAKAQAVDVKQTIQLPASIVPDALALLYAKLPAYVASIGVDRGDKVSKDSLLAELSAPEMEPELALAKAKAGAAQANIARAQASVEVETATHKRLANLHQAEPGAVTQEDVDVSAAKEKIARANAEAERAGLAVANAEVKRLQSLMDYLHVRAPFDGVITQRFVDPGAFVAPVTGNGKAIVEVTRTSKLRLVFNLPERLVPFVPQGYTVRYSMTALPGKSFSGAVSRRGESIDTESRSMRLEIDVDNAAGLLAPGMYGAVEVPLDKAAGVKLVPNAAMRTIDGKTCVLAVVDNKLKKIRVESLLTDGGFTAISGEIPADSVLVVKGPANLVDGQTVDVETSK